jgi:hypothetical protein
VRVHVDEPRQQRCIRQSTTSTPGGAFPAAVTDTILSFSIRMSGFPNGFSLLPSINLAAGIAIRVGACPGSYGRKREK